MAGTDYYYLMVALILNQLPSNSILKFTRMRYFVYYSVIFKVRTEQCE